MLKSRYFLIFSILIGLCAPSQADLLPRSVLLPSYSASVSDDAMATVINPAGLGVGRSFNTYYFHTFSDRAGGDNAFFISASGMGFGAEFSNPGPVKFRKYTLSDGMRLFNGLYLGSSYSWSGSEDESYDSLKSWDIGSLWRPSDLFSMGFVARNLNRPDFNGTDTGRSYDLSFGFRPYTNRLTFSVDTVFQEGRKLRDAKLAAALEYEPFDGIILRGSCNNDNEFDFRVGIGFPQLGVGTYSRFDSDWEHNGGAAYVYFSGERQRTKLRMQRYVLEMETADLARGRMQDSILWRAKEDKAVRGVLLKLGLGTYSMGRLQEMRDAILDFRSSGKKVICYMELAGNKEYYLASACDRILLNSAGYLSLNGLRSEVTFYKGALDKLGIEADLYSVGKYKSALEMFTRESISDAYRESLNSLLDDLADQMISGIAEGRGLSPEGVREKIDGGPYTAGEAMRAGLVDELVYEDQLQESKTREFGKNAADMKGKFYKGFKYRRYDWGIKPKVAVIYATGLMAPGRSMFAEGSIAGLLPQIMGSETLTEAIRAARSDRSIKAIVLRIDSGGGSAFASDVIWREVSLAQAEKPVVVSMGGVAASGGYCIACPADAIVAEPGTVTGSIGVIAGKFSLRGLYDKLGISKEIFKRGNNSDIYTIYAGFTDEQREIVNRQIKEMYDGFVGKVMQGRNMTAEAVETVAQGRVWTGRQARDNGLVDELGDLQLAMSIAKSRAGLKPDEIVDIATLPERIPLWLRFIMGDTSFLAGVLNSAPLASIVDLTERFANDKMFFLMPYTVDFK